MMAAMPKKLRWGVLSTANIGLKKVLPAMQMGRHTSVDAIASRDLAKAQRRRRTLGIPKAYGSYEELLADPEDRRHLQSAAQPAACALDHQGGRSGQACAVREADQPDRRGGEDTAGGARAHGRQDRRGVHDSQPSAVAARAASCSTKAASGNCARWSASSATSTSIRPISATSVEIGGGALMDIGCYLHPGMRDMHLARSPPALSAWSIAILQMKIDRLTSAMLDFPGGQAIFTCSTQLVPYQRCMLLLARRAASKWRFPSTRPKTGQPASSSTKPARFFGSGIVEEFPVADQYTMQGDAFSRAVLEGTEVPVPLEEAIANMAVIEAVFRSGETGQWETPRI